MRSTVSKYSTVGCLVPVFPSIISTMLWSSNIKVPGKLLGGAVPHRQSVLNDKNAPGSLVQDSVLLSFRLPPKLEGLNQDSGTHRHAIAYIIILASSGDFRMDTDQETTGIYL